MTDSTPPPLAAALDRLWTQFLPQFQERITILEKAAAALADGTLSAGQREEAHYAAHKLAGVLGTFGLDEGTALAREAEAVYASGQEIGPGAAARLAQITARLRSLVASRNQGDCI
jgi:HPt (histidine-containing phosphotransfer) domain-containing protein